MVPAAVGSSIWQEGSLVQTQLCAPPRFPHLMRCNFWCLHKAKLSMTHRLFELIQETRVDTAAQLKTQRALPGLLQKWQRRGASVELRAGCLQGVTSAVSVAVTVLRRFKCLVYFSVIQLLCISEQKLVSG